MSRHRASERHGLASLGPKLYYRVNAGGTEAYAFWCDIGIDLDHRLAGPSKDDAKAEDRLLRASDRGEQ